MKPKTFPRLWRAILGIKKDKHSDLADISKLKISKNANALSIKEVIDSMSAD